MAYENIKLALAKSYEEGAAILVWADRRLVNDFFSLYCISWKPQTREFVNTVTGSRVFFRHGDVRDLAGMQFTHAFYVGEDDAEFKRNVEFLKHRLRSTTYKGSLEIYLNGEVYYGS